MANTATARRPPGRYGLGNATDHSSQKPIVIGIYGLSGCGKTHLAAELQEELGTDSYCFYDGSAVIAEHVEEGLSNFKTLSDTAKARVRGRAITSVACRCIEKELTGIVTGHLKLMDAAGSTTMTWTKEDTQVYTHIIYLETSPDVIHERRQNDTTRGDRPNLPVETLREWQDDEILELRQLCYANGIVFGNILNDETAKSKVLDMIRNFTSNQSRNDQEALARLHEIISDGSKDARTVILLDGDKTLTASDTGTLFWKTVHPDAEGKDPFNYLFGSKMRYSIQAFRTAVLLVERACTDEQYERICDKIADQVILHDEFKNLLGKVAETSHVQAIVVTCGLRLIWEKIISKAGLASSVRVIAGGKLRDGFVVTARTKTAIVDVLQVLNKYVWAFGDGPLDIGMLTAADQAVIVTGPAESRSEDMSAMVSGLVRSSLFNPYQLSIPDGVPPLSIIIDLRKAYLSKTDDTGILGSILRDNRGLHIIDTTRSPATDLLATAMRDAANSSVVLRESHHKVGWHLAINYITELLGVEGKSIQHVKGHKVKGFQLKNESRTTIVALMRGGEPMAFGVSEAFPLARFVHAKKPGEIDGTYLSKQRAIILVDSVINTGASILEFVEHIRDNLGLALHIVVVSGVMQRDFQAHGIAEKIAKYGKVSFITLRSSVTKFKGSGPNDTGNRLFNTTDIL